MKETQTHTPEQQPQNTNVTSELATRAVSDVVEYYDPRTAPVIDRVPGIERSEQTHPRGLRFGDKPEIVPAENILRPEKVVGHPSNPFSAQAIHNGPQAVERGMSYEDRMKHQLGESPDSKS